MRRGHAPLGGPWDGAVVTARAPGTAERELTIEDAPIPAVDVLGAGGDALARVGPDARAHGRGDGRDHDALDLARGEIRSCATGACVQVPDYDVGRVVGSVRYADNRVNVETTDLPVPEPAPALTGL